MKAAEEVSGNIIARAKLRAQLAARIAAKKEVDKLLNLQPLPAGTNVTVNQSRFVEDPSIYKIVKAALKSKKKITAAFWKATGESSMTNLTPVTGSHWVNISKWLFLGSLAYSFGQAEAPFTSKVIGSILATGCPAMCTEFIYGLPKVSVFPAVPVSSILREVDRLC